MRTTNYLGWASAVALGWLAAGCQEEGATAVKKVSVSSDAADTASQDGLTGETTAPDGQSADTATDTAGETQAADGQASDAATDSVGDTALPDAATATADSSNPADAADSADTAAQDTAKTDSTANCVGAKGCYSCPPKTNSELLNQCTGNACTAFDNAKRLPLLGVGGKLPPLP